MDGVSRLEERKHEQDQSGPVVLSTIDYDSWNTQESPREAAIRILRSYYWSQAREWRDGVSPEYLQTVQAIWQESLGSYEDRIKSFLPEIQGIVDEKITGGERYDRRSYETYLRIKGLIPYATTPQLSADDVKAAVRIEEVVGRYVQLRKVGSIFTGLCPFHQEKSSSFTVYPKSQTAHCFGCGEHQDVIGFLMKIEGMTFLQALNSLANGV